MSFDVDAAAYDRFMGRYSSRLARAFVAFAQIAPGQRVLDVGCGPGALTAELVPIVGAERVSAVDPSERFVAATVRRHPGVDVQVAPAEALPYPDDTFDATCAQLVVHFMEDPVAGLTEMARITRPGGVVAATVWDFAGDRAPISAFWVAARELVEGFPGEAGLAGARSGHLAQLLGAASLARVEETELDVRIEHASFDEWWEPFTLGVGPAGSYAATLAPEVLAALRRRCGDLLGDGPFTLDATAWAARGRP